ncbi:MAG: type II toxin-antitoxin system VapC family toxin [Rhizobiales bacterium]|nr:type II toxin-antitoxin system VapC family toxin [Hyphomicrobiales bacterium]
MIIDASVATHWFASTAFSASARKILGRDDLIAPALIQIELVSSLLKYLRVEILTAAEIKSASSELRRIIGYFTETDQLIDAATDISIAHNHKRFTTASIWRWRFKRKPPWQQRIGA